MIHGRRMHNPPALPLQLLVEMEHGAVFARGVHVSCAAAAGAVGGAGGGGGGCGGGGRVGGWLFVGPGGGGGGGSRGRGGGFGGAVAGAAAAEGDCAGGGVGGEGFVEGVGHFFCFDGFWGGVGWVVGLIDGGWVESIEVLGCVAVGFCIVCLDLYICGRRVKVVYDGMQADDIGY